MITTKMIAEQFARAAAMCDLRTKSPMAAAELEEVKIKGQRTDESVFGFECTNSQGQAEILIAVQDRGSVVFVTHVERVDGNSFSFNDVSLIQEKFPGLMACVNEQSYWEKPGST